MSSRQIAAGLVTAATELARWATHAEEVRLAVEAERQRAARKNI